MSSLKVLILAGGLGTRVRTLFSEPVPKALLPLDTDGERRFIDWVIRKIIPLKPDGIRVSCGYLSDQVAAYVSNRYSEWPIDFSVDQGESQGCVGAIQQAVRSKWCESSDILILPCDHFFTFDFEEAIQTHCKGENKITLFATESSKSYCRQIEIDKRNVSLIGQYLFSREACEWIESTGLVGGMTDTIFSFPGQKDVFVFGSEYIWEDLGTEERVLKFRASGFI